MAWALAVPAQVRPAPEGPSGWTERAPVQVSRDMVAAAHPAAVAAGVQILAAGGSAIDAAIAVQLVLGVVEPQSSGLGGGAFAVHWDAGSGELTAWDGRETAPLAATPQLFLDGSGQPMAFADAVVGGRAVGTPGVPHLLEALHARHGRLPWQALFAPAIALAESGFEVAVRLHGALASTAGVRDDPAARRLFFSAEGAPVAPGTRVTNGELARTLRALASGGARAFQRGPIAAALVDTVRSQANPGSLTLADLEAYRVLQRTPVCGRYRGYRICGIGMPSSGTTSVLMTLALVERFPLAALGVDSPGAVHLIAEALRLVFADRGRYMADADFVPVPVAGLLDPAYLASRSALIDAGRARGQVVAGAPPGCCGAGPRADGLHSDTAGTSHVSIVDRWGNAVALTTSIESAFGSRRTSGGFFLNNQLTDFSFVPEVGGVPVANRVQPGKRPRSSMAPTLVFDRQDRLVAVLGSAGGAQIIPYVVKTLVGIIDGGLDVRQAIALPNFGIQGDRVLLEQGRVAPTLAAALQAKGHPVAIVDLASGLHAVGRADPRVWPWALAGARWVGAADPRRDGTASGTPRQPAPSASTSPRHRM